MRFWATPQVAARVVEAPESAMWSKMPQIRRERKIISLRIEQTWQHLHFWLPRIHDRGSERLVNTNRHEKCTYLR